MTVHGTGVVGGAGIGGGVFEGDITFDNGVKLHVQGWVAGVVIGGLDSITMDAEWEWDPEETRGYSALLALAAGGFVGGGLVASFSHNFSAIGNLSAAGLGLGVEAGLGSVSFT